MSLHCRAVLCHSRNPFLFFLFELVLVLHLALGQILHPTSLLVFFCMCCVTAVSILACGEAVMENCLLR